MIDKNTLSRGASRLRQNKGETLCESTVSQKEGQQGSDISQAISPAVSHATTNENNQKPSSNKSCYKSGDQSCSSKPDCYSCVYRARVPGSAHSSCRHPKIAPLLDDPLMELLSIMGGSRLGDMSMMFNSVYKLLNISGDEHGKKSGWFNWPVNFDPVWLISCDGYKDKNSNTGE